MKHKHNYSHRYFDGKKNLKKCRCGKREPYHHIVKQAIKKWLYNNRYLFIIIFFALVGGSVIYFYDKTFELQSNIQNEGYRQSDRQAQRDNRQVKLAGSKEANIKKEVLEMFAKAGLNTELAECTVRNESGWREFAYHVNKDSSLDRGIWMWNDRWNPHISNECAFSWKCSTIAAIEKIKADKGYGAWYGNKKCK